MKDISIIVAIAENNAIGKNNELLCHLPNDLKRFKRITTGRTVIMGKKTFESLPNGALPNRTNIVISDNTSDNYKECTTVYSIEEAINHCNDKKENFIIGGGTIYKQFLKHANKLYLTRIYHLFEADTFFPKINFNEWDLIEKEDFEPDEINPYPYSFLTYKRKAFAV